MVSVAEFEALVPLDHGLSTVAIVVLLTSRW